MSQKTCSPGVVDLGALMPSSPLLVNGRSRAPRAEAPGARPDVLLFAKVSGSAYTALRSRGAIQQLVDIVGQYRSGSGRGISPDRAASHRFNQAVALHLDNSFDDAEHIYKEILRTNPRHFGALHLLGVIQCQRGHHA